MKTTVKGDKCSGLMLEGCLTCQSEIFMITKPTNKNLCTYEKLVRFMEN